MSDVLSGAFEPLILIDIVIAAIIIGLGFSLNSKLFPNYYTVKERYQDIQGQDRYRDVIRFED